MRNTEIDPETGVPTEFWAFIGKFVGDPGEFCNALTELDRGKLELYFLIYVQLRADLAFEIMECMLECSEDVAEDLADGLIAHGRETFLKTFTHQQLPPEDVWPDIEKAMLLHEFGGIYENRFGAEIWDLTDALEEEHLPWEKNDA